MADHCELHARHTDALTFEDHHVIPQAWQHYTQAGIPASEAILAVLAVHEGVAVLFDKRTVGVAPTCHRNVHFYIVHIMHALDVRLSPSGALPIVKARGTSRRTYTRTA